MYDDRITNQILQFSNCTATVAHEKSNNTNLLKWHY